MFQPGESSKTLHGHLNLARLAAFQCEPLLNKALYQVTLSVFPPLLQNLALEDADHTNGSAAQEVVLANILIQHLWMKVLLSYFPLRI